jgi:hypothetical protein
MGAAAKHRSFLCIAVHLWVPKVVVPSHRIRRSQPNKFRESQPKPKHFKAKNHAKASNRIPVRKIQPGKSQQPLRKIATATQEDSQLAKFS